MSETRPPEPWANKPWHWLHSERSSEPVIAQWLNNVWWCVNERGRVTPEQMHRRGWVWYGPAIYDDQPTEGSPYVVPP